MSAYVALVCLFAFVIVITICLVKQFIWDPLLSKHFEGLRPYLFQSVRRLSAPFFRSQSSTLSTVSLTKSTSDSYIKTNEPPISSTKNFITIPQNLPSTNNQISPINKNLSQRTYGSAAINSHAYTNYGSDDIPDEKIHPYPILHFSCEYDPSTFDVRLNIQNVRHLNSLLPSFGNGINRNAHVFIKFTLSTALTNESYETMLQQFQDVVRLNETFHILNSIRLGDTLNYQLKFVLMLRTDKAQYELGDAIYSMKDDRLTNVLHIEKVLPIRSIKN